MVSIYFEYIYAAWLQVKGGSLNLFSLIDNSSLPCILISLSVSARTQLHDDLVQTSGDMLRVVT